MPECISAARASDADRSPMQRGGTDPLCTMPGLLRLIVPAVPPLSRDAMSRDVQYVGTRALIKGVTVALGVQLCLAMGGTAAHAAWMHTAAFIGLLSSLFYAQLGRGRSPLVMLYRTDTMACLLLMAVGLLGLVRPGPLLPTAFAVMICIAVATLHLGAPLQSTVYAYVYPAELRGSIISFTRLFFGLSTILGLVVLGELVAQSPDAKWLLYPAIGLLALFSVRRFCSIRLPEGAVIAGQSRGLFGFLGVLRRDRAYARYQFFQFILGTANLTGIPMIAVFAREKLDLPVNVAVFVVSGGVVEQAIILLSVRWHGWLYDRIGVIWHRVVTSSLVLCAYLMWSTATDAWMAGVACALAGLGLAGGQIIWQIGALHFAPKGEESSYAGVHTFLTGLRGLIAPLLGLWLLRTVFEDSYREFFLFCAVLIAISIVGHALFVRLPQRQAADD